MAGVRATTQQWWAAGSALLRALPCLYICTDHSGSLDDSPVAKYSCPALESITVSHQGIKVPAKVVIIKFATVASTFS